MVAVERMMEKIGVSNSVHTWDLGSLFLSRQRVLAPRDKYLLYVQRVQRRETERVSHLVYDKR